MLLFSSFSAVMVAPLSTLPPPSYCVSSHLQMLVFPGLPDPPKPTVPPDPVPPEPPPLCCYFVDPISASGVGMAFHLSLSQVCSSLYPAFPTVDCLRNLEELLALFLSSVLPPCSKASDSRVPILLSIGSSFNAFVCFLTAVCRVFSVFSVTGYASCSFHMWQIRKNCLSCFPPVNLAWDFHSPHLSVKELISLPSTSLDLSGIVAGSIVLKAVLVRADEASGSRVPILLPIDAFVRFLTAVCRVFSVFSVTGYASCSFHMWQIRKNCLSCFLPVNLALDFHSPHLSVKEFIFLPSTSLDLSGIVAGSIVLKAVLVRAVTKRFFVSRSSIDFVDGLTFSLLEAFIPPLGGLDQDGLCCFGLIATSVELARSHLSPYLYLSCCVLLCLTLGSTNLWSDALVCLASCGLLYPLLLEINS